MDRLQNNDPQLERAVQEILKDLKNKTRNYKIKKDLQKCRSF